MTSDDRARTRISHHANPYRVATWDRDPPAGTSCEPLLLDTEDGALAHGWLYARGGESSVVCVVHPRADFSHHYLVPGLVERGVAVLCGNTRWLNNDATLVHETALLDVAALVGAARSRYDHVALCGNSGGGALVTYYLEQALGDPGARVATTPAGDRTRLVDATLPVAEAVVYLAAHLGEGHYLLHAIDPSVSDERDPGSVDPALDPFDPRNGFREPPEPTTYAAEFVARYRSAQRDRVARLDEEARRRVARRRAARERARTGADPTDRRAAIATDFLLVYRTDADLRAVDPTIDPSDRTYGSLWGSRPDLTNYGAVGFGRLVSPEAWLSTWSGLSSRASILRAGPAVSLPALVVSYGGDHAIFPSDHDALVAALAASDPEQVVLPGDHYGFPATDGREPAAGAVAEWVTGL